ncbi:hypothetical protein P9D81_00995 [Bacillus haynesii]|uniref:hypothetical protein n=1 Tax=Bacillus haynesii TaxID=1925021 RepID=UPI002DB7822C|nr:hypothetical protein [Bacillus haynesii]MEC0633376.1 hypothetical protein [Bacillus haynesii]MEC1653458.1 hypothetical protein [Bacillus haynesii]
MNKTKLLTAILGLSMAGNAALGIYAAKLNEDAEAFQFGEIHEIYELNEISRITHEIRR